MITVLKKILEKDAKLGSDSYTLFEVPGDGNCLFSTLGFLLYINDLWPNKFDPAITHQYVRTDVIKTIKLLQNEDYWQGVVSSSVVDESRGKAESTWEAYRTQGADWIASLERGDWGDAVSIQAVVELYGFKIRVWEKAEDKKNWKQVGETFQAQSHLSNYFYEHFEVDEQEQAEIRGLTFDLAWINAADIKSKRKNHYCPFVKNPLDDWEEPDRPPEQVVPVEELLEEEVDKLSQEEAVDKHTVSRSHKDSDSVNTLDTGYQLPLIDSHCHLGGASLAGGKHGVLQAVTKLGATVDSKIAYYMLAPETQLVTKIVESMKHFCRDVNLKQYVAAIALVLDLGFCPLKVPGAATGAASTKRAVGKGGKKAAKTVSKGLKKIKEVFTREETPEEAQEGPEPLEGVSIMPEKMIVERNNVSGEKMYYSLPDDDDAPSYLWTPRDRAFWEKALDEISEALKEYPAHVWPFVGFDPRRQDDGLAVIRNFVPKKGFVGVKLYSRTGWMPIHNRVMYGDEVGDPMDDRLDALYQHLVQDDIPVLVHASPTGFPPDGVFAFPWTFTYQRTASGKYTCTTGAAPKGYGNINAPLWPPTYTDKEILNGDGLRDPIQAIKGHASALAHYNLYVQWTTSPYHWEPVLDHHKNLRLCLAHFGAEIGAYATPMRDIPEFEKWQVGLETHPYVAGADGPRAFRPMFKKEVHRRAVAWLKKDKSFYEKDKILQDFSKRVFDEIYDNDFFEKDPAWRQWLQAWERAYPLSWHEKIHKLLASGKYPNLYTDIAYITTVSDMFPKAFGPMVVQALDDSTADGKALKEKLMVGTDWFMIEMQSWSPRDFWKAVWGTFERNVPVKSVVEYKNRQILWDLWTSQNTIRWVNLKPRMNDLETFYGSKKLPVWWADLKKYYEKDTHKKVRKYLDSVSQAQPPSDQDSSGGSSGGSGGSGGTSGGSRGSGGSGGRQKVDSGILGKMPSISP